MVSMGHWASLRVNGCQWVSIGSMGVNGCGLPSRKCSTSLPGGNQVDGLPPAASFEFGSNAQVSVKKNKSFDIGPVLIEMFWV